MFDRPSMIWHSGNSFRDPLDRLQGPKPELAVVLVAGADGEGQRVEDQVVGRQAVPHAGEVVQTLGDLHLARRLLGHADLVDGERDHRGAELARQLEAFFGRLLAVLEVDRVQHRLAAVELERGLPAPGARWNRPPEGRRPSHACALPPRPSRPTRRGRRRRCKDRSRASPRAPARRPWRRRHPSRRPPGAGGTCGCHWHCSARRSRDRRSPGDRTPGRRATPDRASHSDVRGAAPDGAPCPLARRSRRSMASSAAMCSGVVPQQPPIMLRPSSVTKRSSQLASSSGDRG